MFRSNLPVWERAVRGLLGVALIWVALARFEGSLLSWALIAAGATALITALVAFCPVCAIAGRRAVY